MAIHRASGHPEMPFVVMNCAAVVDTLLISDMFGHEKGAFTGAISRQVGKFALADQCTIFLAEVGEMSPTMQANGWHKGHWEILDVSRPDGGA